MASRPSQDTAPSAQSKGFTHPRVHNATTPPVPGVHSKGHARPRQRHGAYVPQAKSASPSKQDHDTAPSTQSKGSAHPRLHNAATPPVPWGTFERSHEAETAPRHLCATAAVAWHHLAENTLRSAGARTREEHPRRRAQTTVNPNPAAPPPSNRQHKHLNAAKGMAEPRSRRQSTPSPLLTPTRTANGTTSSHWSP